MSDETTQVLRDQDLIRLKDFHEVRDWANSLGVTELELREAVAAVGESADKVRQYLASQ
jgi:hypothetical protein